MDDIETCEDCEYYYCGVNTCFCKNYVNELEVPRVIRKAPQIPLWCPLEENREQLRERVNEIEKKNTDDSFELDDL